MLGSLIVACSCWVASSIARLQNELEHSHFFFFRKVDYRGLIHHKGLPCSRRKPRIPPASHRKPDEWPREPAFCQIGVFESHAAHSTFAKKYFSIKRRAKANKADEGERRRTSRPLFRRFSSISSAFVLLRTSSQRPFPSGTRTTPPDRRSHGFIALNPQLWTIN
jgi:hypothetical protein